MARLWYAFSYSTKNAKAHQSILSTRHSAVTIGILPTMAGRCEHTTVCTLEPFYKEHVIEMSRHEIAQHIAIILMANMYQRVFYNDYCARE